MIRVLVVDDHQLVRQGIRSLLDKASDIDVIGEAEDGQEALELIEQMQPDVALMDVSMPRLDGIQATQQIIARDLPVKVIALTMHDDTVLIKEMLQKGARGYVLKQAAFEELVAAIEAAWRGHMFVSPAVSGPVFESLLHPVTQEESASYDDLLTPREREVLQLIVEGHTNAAVADQLSISIKTVEKHRSNLMSKLDVHDLASLIRVAIKHKLIFLDSL